MNRIENKILEIKNNSDKFLVAYLTGGFPDIEGCIEYFKALESGGADIIEIGVPFSDALADGPVNQKAAYKAIEKGIACSDLFEMVLEIRKTSEIPIIFLVYYNTVYHFGSDKFMAECFKNGVDGLVIPDLPMEERGEIMDAVHKNNLCLIPLIAPTSRHRIKDIISGMKGFTYCVSSMGVTGERKKFSESTDSYVNEVKGISELPVAVGFGISDSKVAGYFYEITDGIIVGSSIVKRILNGCTADELELFVQTLKYNKMKKQRKEKVIPLINDNYREKHIDNSQK